MDALLPGPQDGPTPVPCRSHAGPRLPVGTGGGRGRYHGGVPDGRTAMGIAAGPLGRHIRASPRDPIRSGPFRSPPVPTSAAGLGKLGKKIGSDDRNPTRAPWPGPSRHPRASSQGSSATREKTARHGRPDDRPEPPAGWRPGAGHTRSHSPTGRGGDTGGCWSTRPGDPHTLLRERGGGGVTPSQAWRFNLPRADRAPTPQRERDNHASVTGFLELRLGDRSQMPSLTDIGDALAG